MRITEELIKEAEELRVACFKAQQSLYGNPGHGAAGRMDMMIARAKGRLLLMRLGPYAKAFEKGFADRFEDMSDREAAIESQANASTILEAIQKGRFNRIDEIVTAEVLGGLRGHAEQLSSGGFHLAAAVVLRAVLEERLRLLCESRDCSPDKAKPTLEDFNQALYKHGKDHPESGYTRATMTWVQAMAAVGNDAAHNLREITRVDAERMLGDVDRFLAQFSP